MSRFRRRCPVIIVEGLIGGGKTVLSRELGAALDAAMKMRDQTGETLVLLEPDEKDNANPYLSDYYGDPKRWSLTMQMHLLSARFRMHKEAQWHALNGSGPAVMDRSYFGDTAFARLQLELGLMSKREFDTYSGLFHGMTSSVLLPTVCVRVLVDPETCNKRISSRMLKETGRTCEQAIDLSYLQGLDRHISHMVNTLRGLGVVVLDMPWDLDREAPDQRQTAVKSLADRILAIEPPDFFLQLYHRSVPGPTGLF